ncbi:MAG TPA: enoyl-CoA hydratase/isomerase family protein [bacterium]|nr:enoyl-CoA hydratase/isomerase family protein [bacterium]
MPYETIKFETEGPVGVLTMNRPERMNAMNYAMRDELRAFFMERLADTDCRVIVLTGAGKGFCSGLDLKDSAITKPENRYTPKLAYELQRRFSDVILFMRRCPQPIIGALNGAAVGAGFSVAMACDIRVAAPPAKFSAAYINIGTGGADMGSSWLFTRQVGTGNAARWLLTGDFFGADEALRIGFAQELVPADQLMDRALGLARNLAGKSPLGLRLTKEALDRNTGAMSLEDAIRLEDRNQALCISELAAGMKK